MKRSLSAIALAAACVVPLLGASCSPTPQSQYEVFECPSPIGRIVREDCSRSSLRWDGVQAEAKVGAAGFSAGGSYKDQAIREADDLVALLKEQRSALCQDFNTCKLTVEQYRLDKERIESTASAVLAIRGNVEKISSGDVAAYLEEIRKIRTGGGANAHAGPPAGGAPAPAATTAAHRQEPDGPPPTVDVEWRPGRYMLEAVGRVADEAHAVEQQSALGFDVDHGCLLGAAIVTGEIISIRQSMKGGLEYAILGGGSSNSGDVDIAVLDPNGKPIAADTDDDATPRVHFVAPRDGAYEIKLQLAQATGGGAFVAMAILHKGGYAIPATSLVQSIKSAVSNAGKASAKVSTMGARGLVFHESHDWSFFGTVLKPGEEGGMRGFTLVTDPTVLLGVADAQGTNIDVRVNETQGGRLVAKDDGADAEPLVIVHPEQGKRYDFTLKNSAAAGTTLATAVLLDVVK
jgi:hypothetical protein